MEQYDKDKLAEINAYIESIKKQPKAPIDDTPAVLKNPTLCPSCGNCLPEKADTCPTCGMLIHITHATKDSPANIGGIKIKPAPLLERQKKKPKKLAEHAESFGINPTAHEVEPTPDDYSDLETTERRGYCPWCNVTFYGDNEKCKFCGEKLIVGEQGLRDELVEQRISYYSGQFKSFDSHMSPVSLNIAAFLYSGYWFSYRKMLLPGIIIAVVDTIITSSTLIPFTPMWFVWFAYKLIIGLFANFIYYKHIDKCALEYESSRDLVKKQVLAHKSGVSVKYMLITAAAVALTLLTLKVFHVLRPFTYYRIVWHLPL